MVASENEGKIVTFYSFKGGVGRTMALANVAYLAAYHHKRVLVMDWDLEAPGLLYYFRGLSNPDTIENAKHSRGVLDILWDWRNSALDMRDNEAMDGLLRRFSGGEPFRDCVHSITDRQAIAQSGDLHYMGAGSPFIDGVSYAQALSMFPWSAFYEESAGGVLIDLWRRWAKANYDLILIDSRTGLADVAGLCTMQFPDEVVLCLVLNRQNIDGTGRVAASIREARHEAVGLRAAPMRVARADTSEESDARARAFAVLTRIGGFTLDQVARDFSQLSIPASESVPFYETLTPFATPDPMLDLLTLHYCKMASSLLGAEITAPIIDDSFRKQVRRRQGQDQRSATPDYVQKLISTEPARAVDELARLVDSAWAAMHDDERLSELYVGALADAATQIDAPEFDDELFSIRDTLIQLLRRLFLDDPARWRKIYATFLEWIYNNNGPGDDASINGISLLDELDVALSDDFTPSGILRRIGYRRRAAWQTWSQTIDVEATTYLVDDVVDTMAYVQTELELTDDERAECVAAISDMAILKGDMALSNKKPDEAITLYESAAEQTAPTDGDWGRLRMEARRLNGMANLRIAFRHDLVSPETAANHALRALDAQATYLAHAQLFLDFCTLFAISLVSQSATFKFIQHYLGTPLGRGTYAGTLGLRRAILPQMLRALNALAIKVGNASFQDTQLPSIGAAAMRILDAARLRMPSGSGPLESLRDAAEELAETMLSRAEELSSSQLHDMASSIVSRAAQIDQRNLREAE